MTKKHFEAIASIMHEVKPNTCGMVTTVGWFEIVEKLADYFQEENQRFNRSRFVSKCVDFYRTK